MVESSTSATSATSATLNETGRQDHQLALHEQSTDENIWIPRDAVRNDSIAKEISESPQVSNESGHLVIDSDGDLVVGDRFWTVFCKEVCFSSSPSYHASPDCSRALGLCHTFLAELYTRWSKFSKPSMDPHLPTLRGTAARQQCRHLVIDVTTGSIISSLRIHLLCTSKRIYILFHHRCCFSGRSMWTVSIRS